MIINKSHTKIGKDVSYVNQQRDLIVKSIAQSIKKKQYSFKTHWFGGDVTEIVLNIDSEKK